MNILGLIEKLLNSGGGSGVFINPDFCVRLKTPMAGCYECIDRCPDLSIKITDNDIKIMENCSNCNACLYICPNSVFYVKNNISVEHGGGRASAGNIYYFCAKTENKKAVNKVNKIECLYGIEDIDIISLIKQGSKIFFISEDCKSCKLKYFYNKKLKRVNEIKKFLNAENAFAQININDFDYDLFSKEQTADDSAEPVKINENIEGKSLTVCFLTTPTEAKISASETNPITKFLSLTTGAHVTPPFASKSVAECISESPDMEIYFLDITSPTVTV